jgi:hypothetical protein
MKVSEQAPIENLSFYEIQRGKQKKEFSSWEL